MNIVSTLQMAIGPMILISAIGLFMLTMTNRLGRAIDRARALGSRTGDDRERAGAQLEILWNRARLLRVGILCASTSALCAAVLVITLFLSAVVNLSLTWVIGALFTAGMLSLIASFLYFIHDVNLSLEALRMELGRP